MQDSVEERNHIWLTPAVLIFFTVTLDLKTTSTFYC